MVATHSADAKPLLPKPLLLVVDDQPSNIQLLYGILQRDYEVCMATSGAQAIEFCRSRAPDLILLDVVMPGMSGYEVCHWLKACDTTHNIPIIFVTAQNDPSDEAQGLNAGAVDFIAKPFHAAVVLARVLTHLTIKAQTEQLRLLNERMAIATQAVGIGVWDLDLATNTYVLDDRILELYGSARGSFDDVAVELMRRVHPDDRQFVRAQHQAAIASVTPMDIQFRIVRPNGEERVIRSVASTLSDGQGPAQRMTGVIWDITELKKAERMKVEFTASVSHELRTPLTSIRGALGLLVGGATGALPAATERVVAIALRNADRLAVLIDDFLEMEKMEIGQLRFDIARHSLTQLIEQSIEANAGYASQHRVRFQLVGNPVDVDVAVDAHRCLQVLANLLSNAAKFSPADATVDISINTVESYARVSIRDHGPGIPEEFKARVFGKFAQAAASTHSQHGKNGTGLGLSISKTIVERMGGRIGFDAIINSGATFFFDVPIASRDHQFQTD